MKKNIFLFFIKIKFKNQLWYNQEYDTNLDFIYKILIYKYKMILLLWYDYLRKSGNAYVTFES